MTRRSGKSSIGHARLPLRDDEEFVGSMAVEFMPCECAVKTFVGVPVGACARRKHQRMTIYRCLRCGRVWSESWLARRTADIHARMP